MRLATTSFALGIAVVLCASRARAAPPDAQPVQPVLVQPAPVQPVQPAPVQPPSDVSSDARPPAKAEKLGKRVAGFATVALGMPGLAFVNELVGARFEVEYKRSFSFGGSLAYANLKGKEGRVSNVLPEVWFGYYAPLGKSFGFPIRFACGFLPKNGPTARLSYGLGFTFSEKVSLELALVEPMIWVARDRPELSFNLGASVLGRF